MSDLINIDAYPVKELLPILLQDKSTKKNIIWATDAYTSLGPGYADKNSITTLALSGDFVLQPRIAKSFEAQLARTRKKAEVMTPVWICNKMINYADEEWFGRKNVFNVELEDHQWDVVDADIWFPEGKTWQSYVDSRRLEITCGEAPYLVSRYDTTTGELIVPPKRRIGMLDRKLRIVNENTNSKADWIKWAERAMQASYGYEYQGDNLLIARCNCLLSYYEYYKERFMEDPDLSLLKRIANIIAWNIWQMDGLKDTVPLGKPHEEFHQMTLFELFSEKTEQTDDESEAVPCKIFDWRSNNSITFKKLKEM